MIKKLLRIIGRFDDKFMAEENYFAPDPLGAKSTEELKQ